MKKIPLVLLTGFLGSGKTTLLNRLLRDPRMADTLVVVNEVGAVALDHELVEAGPKSVVTLDNGCLCCTLQGALSGALRTLFWQRHDKKIPAFSQIIIETTGLADPFPIMRELLSHPNVLQHYALSRIVTCVDGLFAQKQLVDHPELARQIDAADLLLLTKTDLATVDERGELVEKLQRMNPAAPVLNADTCSVDVFLESDLMTPPRLDAQWKPVRYDRAMPRQPTATDSTRHGDLQAFAFQISEPVKLAFLTATLNAMAGMPDAQIARIKGIFNVVGSDQPHVVHMVRELIFPVEKLASWSRQAPVSRLVVIGRHVKVEQLLALIKDGLGVPAEVVVG